MTSLATLIDWESLNSHRTKVNSNFSALNSWKIETTWKTDWTQTVFWNGIDQTKFEADGTPIFEWTATTWEDENIDPTTLSWTWTLPISIVFASTTTHIAWFSGIQVDEVEFCKEYPHKAKLNVPWETSVKLSFHAHTYPTTAVVWNVRLWLEYFFTKEGVAVTTSTTIYKTFATSGTAWTKQSIAFDDIPAPEELGSQFHWRFFRAWNDVLDTYNSAIWISTIGFHYEIDSIGSHLITTK